MRSNVFLGHQFSKNEFTSFAIFCFGSKAGNSKGSWLISRLKDACTRWVASSANAETAAPEASVAVQLLARMENEKIRRNVRKRSLKTCADYAVMNRDRSYYLELQKLDGEIYRVLHPLYCPFFHKYPEK